MRSPRALIAAAVLIASAVALSACGIPTDSSPHPLTKSDIPFGLLKPASTTTTTIVPAVSVPVTVYLVANGGAHLDAVSRKVSFPGTLAAIIDALLTGPTNAEAAAGVQTAIAAQTKLLSVATMGPIATVNLSDSFGKTVGPELITAVAQVVYTVTAVPGIAEVLFELGGQPASVPTATGTLASGPVSRADFASLAP